MDLKRITLALPALDAEKELPKEIRIFAFGVTATEKGPYEFDRDDAEKVLAGARQWGNRFSFDYEHRALHAAQSGEGPAPAAGWYELELRDDGLWAVNIEWTDRAAAYLRAKEYRYFSPAFHVDPEGHVTDLLNVALTNLPATRDMEPLVAATAVPFEAGPVISGAWDGDAAEGRLRRWASSDGSGDKNTIDWGKYAKGFGYFDAPGSHLGNYHLPHHDVQNGRLVVSRRGVEAAAAAVQGSRGASTPAADLDAVKNHLAKHYREWNATAPWETDTHTRPMEVPTMKTLFAALSLSESASESEAVAAVARLKETTSSIVALTGREALPEAMGVIAGWKSEAAKVPALAAKLEEIEGAQKLAKIDALISAGTTDGKITPATEEFFRAMGRQDLSQLEAFLSVATPVVPTAAVREPAHEDAVVELTAEDKVAAHQLGIPEATFLAEKRARASAQA